MNATNLTACSWCLQGALLRVFGLDQFESPWTSDNARLAWSMRDNLILDFPKEYRSLTTFNDDQVRTKEGVLNQIEITKARLRQLQEELAP